jgi:hypothetical protein
MPRLVIRRQASPAPCGSPTRGTLPGQRTKPSTLNGGAPVPDEATSSTAPISEEEVPNSRFDALVSLQLRVDSRYDLCREAWQRAEALICREFSAYLGCETSRVKLQPESKSGGYLERNRELRLSVELANGFTPTFRLDVSQSSYSAQACSAREWRKPRSQAWRAYDFPTEPPAREPDAVDLAWTEDVCRRFPDVEYSHQRATRVGLTIGLNRVYAEVTLTYCPQATGAYAVLFPAPDWSATVVGAIARDGSRPGAIHPDTAFDALGECLVSLLKKSIHSEIESRAVQPDEKAPERPSWL